MTTPYDYIKNKNIEKLKNTNILWWSSNNALLEIKGKKVAVILDNDSSNRVKSIWDYEKELEEAV